MGGGGSGGKTSEWPLFSPFSSLPLGFSAATSTFSSLASFYYYGGGGRGGGGGGPRERTGRKEGGMSAAAGIRGKGEGGGKALRGLKKKFRIWCGRRDEGGTKPKEGKSIQQGWGGGRRGAFERGKKEGIELDGGKGGVELEVAYQRRDGHVCFVPTSFHFFPRSSSYSCSSSSTASRSALSTTTTPRCTTTPTTCPSCQTPQTPS